MNINDFEILNPQPGAIRTEDGIVVATSGGSMWGGGNTCRNLLLCAPVPAPLVAELSVTIAPENNGEQAGLVIYKDSDNYIKLVREMVAGRQVVVLAKEIKGEAGPVFIEDFVSPAVNLRMRVENDVLQVAWQTPGGDDQTVRNHEHWLGDQAGLRIGLLTHGQNPENRAVFTEFNLAAR